MTDVKGLKVVKVRKDDLLPKIKQNRENHVKEYKEAYEAWKVLKRETFNREIKRLKRQYDEIATHTTIFLPKEPEDHTKDYDRVISMLSMSVEKELELPVDEFSRYVLDEWDWTQEFKTVSAAYNGALAKTR